MRSKLPPKKGQEKKKGDQQVTKIPSPFLTLLGSLLSKKVRIIKMALTANTGIVKKGIQ